MSNKTILYIERHGESIGNMTRRFLGHTDLALSDLGFSQAKQTAEALASVSFEAIYSSDLLRALMTATPHALLRNMEIIKSENLREMFCGDWENLTRDYILEHYEEEFLVGWKKEFGTFTIPGGEPIPAVAERIEKELKRIAELHPGKTVLVVTHAAAIRAFYAKISKIPPELVGETTVFPSNASYSIVEFEDGEFAPVAYSCDSHLDNRTPLVM